MANGMGGAIAGYGTAASVSAEASAVAASAEPAATLDGDDEHASSGDAEMTNAEKMLSPTLAHIEAYMRATLAPG